MCETLFYTFDGGVCVVACCYFAAYCFYGCNCGLGGAGDNDIDGGFKFFFVLREYQQSRCH